MASSNGTPRQDGPSFSFGEMALSEGTPLDGFIGLDGLDENLAYQRQAERDTLLSQIRKLMLNEQFSPDILPFSQDVVQKVQDLVKTQSEAVDDEEDGDDAPIGFEIHIKRMEIDRVNYLLRSYFRLRIKKIEKHIFYIFEVSAEDTQDGPRLYERLSKDEQEFAKSYMDIVDTHFKQSFLTLMPERLRKLDKDGTVKLASKPNLEKFTFCRMCKTMGSYAVSDRVDDLPIDLNQGDIICARYSRIQNLVDSESAELV